jgi:hypothetical protein
MTTELPQGAPGLLPQPSRPADFPLRVPVVAECGSEVVQAEVLSSTQNVLLLEGAGELRLPPLGTPVRLRVDWDRRQLNGRLAAHGVASRFLVSLGQRAIRRTRRYPVDLPATLRSPHLYGPEQVRISDLSSGGARVQGLALPVGSELDLTFTPPGKKVALTVQGFVVRTIDDSARGGLGVAFRLASAAVDVLGAAARKDA